MRSETRAFADWRFFRNLLLWEKMLDTKSNGGVWLKEVGETVTEEKNYG